MTGAISGAGAGQPSDATEFRLNEASIAQSLVFCVVFCRPLFVFLYF